MPPSAATASWVRARSGVTASAIGPPAAMMVWTTGRSSTTSLPGACRIGLAGGGSFPACGRSANSRSTVRAISVAQRARRYHNDALAHQNVFSPPIDVVHRHPFENGRCGGRKLR